MEISNGIPYNPMPCIDTFEENGNPCIESPRSEYCICFYQTRETLCDPEVYKAFLKNIEYRFRHSSTYTNYKKMLYEIGLNRCQALGLITSEMASIEMHHAILTLFDIAMIITEHMLNTVGYVTTFDVIEILKEEHKSHNVGLVMLTKTAHQLYHNNKSFYIHPNMVFGNWKKLIEKYKDGLTQDIAFKLLYYLKQSIDKSETDDNGLLDLRDKIKSWSGLGE